MLLDRLTRSCVEVDPGDVEAGLGERHRRAAARHSRARRSRPAPRASAMRSSNVDGVRRVGHRCGWEPRLPASARHELADGISPMTPVEPLCYTGLVSFLDSLDALFSEDSGRLGIPRGGRSRASPHAAAVWLAPRIGARRRPGTATVRASTTARCRGSAGSRSSSGSSFRPAYFIDLDGPYLGILIGTALVAAARPRRRHSRPAARA